MQRIGIAAAQHSVRLLWLDISGQYLQDLASGSPQAVLAVFATDWSDLLERAGRIQILRHVWAIMKYEREMESEMEGESEEEMEEETEKDDDDEEKSD